MYIYIVPHIAMQYEHTHTHSLTHVHHHKYVYTYTLVIYTLHIQVPRCDRYEFNKVKEIGRYLRTSSRTAALRKHNDGATFV